MVIKVYISGISGNKEVNYFPSKKTPTKGPFDIGLKNVKYEVIDIAEPGAEEIKDFVQSNSTACGGTISDPKPRHPLPPQIFNDDVYCGDYDLFDMANEVDEMEKFLKLEVIDKDQISTAEIKLQNGAAAKEGSVEKESSHEENDTKESEVPKEQAEISKDEEIAEKDNELEKESGAGDDKVENGTDEEAAKKELSPEKEYTKKEPSPEKEDTKKEPSPEKAETKKETSPEKVDIKEPSPEKADE